MSQRPMAILPGPMLPKFTVRDGVMFWPETSVPMIWKSISRPFSFSTILGWLEVMRMFLAVPLPRFSTITARLNGMLGSICGVNGSSA